MASVMSAKSADVQGEGAGIRRKQLQSLDAGAGWCKSMPQSRHVRVNRAGPRRRPRIITQTNLCEVKLQPYNL